MSLSAELKADKFSYKDYKYWHKTDNSTWVSRTFFFFFGQGAGRGGVGWNGNTERQDALL